MKTYYDYGTSDKNEMEFNIPKFLLLIILSLILFLCSTYLIVKESRRIQRVELSIQIEKLQKTIEIYKEKKGYYPDLAGNENTLEQIMIDDKELTFADLYGSNQLYIVKRKSNTIVSKQDGTYGWVYDRKTGVIIPNN